MRIALSRRGVWGAAVVLLFAALAPAQGAGLTYEIQTWSVDAGTLAVLVEDHRAPIVEVDVQFPVGGWSAWAHDSHAEEAWSIQMWDSQGALRARADQLATDIGMYMSSRESVAGASCRKDDLPEVLKLVREILSNRDFDRAELGRRKKSREIDWEASLKNPQFVMEQTVARLIFAPDDPRRRPYEPPEKLETDVAKLAATRDAIIRLPGRVIGFAGDLTRAEAEQLARDLLPPAADRAPEGAAPHLPALQPRSQRGAEKEVALPRLTQVYLAYARDSLTLQDPDKPAEMIADHVLGGHFYSRLYEALRHEEGDTYGTGTEDTGGELAPGAYAAWTFTKTQNAAHTDQKLREVVKVLHDSGITEEERAAAAGYLLGRRAFERQSPGQVLNEFMWEHWRGLPRGFRDQLAEKAAATALQDINAFIRKFYDPAQFTMVKLVPRS